MKTQEIIKGEVYVHFKGGIYIVLNIAKHTETNEELVIYKKFRQRYIPHAPVFARPLDMFAEWIERDGYSGFRMTLEAQQ